jgi:hypothetical protein
MTRRRLVLAIGFTLVFVGLAIAAQPQPSQAAGVEFGWWWKGSPGEQVPVPAGVPVPAQNFPTDPPAAPEPPNATGGLMVAALPDGAFAVAAVRAPLNATSLTLDVAPNGDAGGQVAHLFACQAASPWIVASAGRWDDKPIVACDLVNGGGSVAGIRSEDGLHWTFPVAPLVGNDQTDVVIVPAADPTVPAGAAAPFQLVFQPPTISSFVAGPTSSVADDSLADDTSSAFDAGTGTGDFAALGFGPDAFDSSAAVAAPALPSSGQAPVLASAPRAAASDDDGASKALGVVVMLLGLAAILAANRQSTPAIHSLTRMGATTATAVAPSETGGLGRFVAEREGKPPALF